MRRTEAINARSVSPPPSLSSSPFLLLRDKRSFAALYAALLALLGVSWLFVTSRESTLFEVFLTFALPLVIVGLFFFWQAMCFCYEAGGAVSELLEHAWRLWPKLLAASLPLLFAGGSLFSLAARLSAYISLILGALLPLFTIHLWLATAQHGILGAWRNAGQVLAQTFAPRSLLTYVVGLLGFAVAPYLLAQARLPLPGRWQIAWFVARLALALAIALFAWLATVVTLKCQHSKDAY
jgi:hypothetical protein